MELLAAALQGSIGEKVLDATGLTGVFDLNLDYNHDEGKPFEGPTIFEAVQRQLGFKLEAGKGPLKSSLSTMSRSPRRTELRLLARIQRS